MNTMTKNLFLALIALGVVTAPATLLAKERTEAEYIKLMDEKDEGDVASAMMGIEKNFPTSEAGVAKIRKMLVTDNRIVVKRKAARVLGVLHTELNADEAAAIFSLLKNSEKFAVMDGLKALRGLNVKGATDAILPLLNHADLNVIRDSLRTLSEIGGKDLVPKIEPLLNHADKAVKKDAQDALFKLKQKN